MKKEGDGMAIVSSLKERRDDYQPSKEPVKNIGLRGVTVADTRISDVDGTNGILIYRGYRIEELASRSTFEETAYLLLHDSLPNEEQLEDFKSQLGEARELPSYLFESLKK